MDAAFARTSRGMRRWDDPHPAPERLVANEEYSRVTDPARWRIIGARVDAWIDVLVADGVASVARDQNVDWGDRPGPTVTRVDVVRPVVAGGLPLVVGRSRIGAVDDAGVTLGVGLPATFLAAIPDCGCDACDSGSADVIQEVDTWVGGIVRGELRHLVRPRCTITVVGDVVRRASHHPELPSAAEGWRWAAAPGPADGEIRDAPVDRPTGMPFDVDAVLADPIGWREWSGPAWIG